MKQDPLTPRVNPPDDALSVLRGRRLKGPVISINLMRLRPHADVAAFIEQLALAADHVISGHEGVEMLHIGAPGPEMITGELWDIAVIARYPAVETYIGFLSDQRWVETTSALRQMDLEAAQLFVMPAGLSLDEAFTGGGRAAS